VEAMASALDTSVLSMLMVQIGWPVQVTMVMMPTTTHGLQKQLCREPRLGKRGNIDTSPKVIWYESDRSTTGMNIRLCMLNRHKSQSLKRIT
jgi:hypothetical protein